MCAFWLFSYSRASALKHEFQQLKHLLSVLIAEYYNNWHIFHSLCIRVRFAVTAFYILVLQLHWVLHYVSKKVPTFELSVTLSNVNRFVKILHCREFEFLIFQGSVATCLRCDEYCRMGFVANFIQKFWKPVKIWRSCREFKGGNFFETQCSMFCGVHISQREVDLRRCLLMLSWLWIRRVQFSGALSLFSSWMTGCAFSVADTMQLPCCDIDWIC